MVQQWLTAFWSENSGGIIAGLIIGGVLLLPTAIINGWLAPSSIRQRRTLRGKQERLRRHLANKKNPVPELVFCVLMVTTQLATWFAGFAISTLIVLINYRVVKFLPSPPSSGTLTVWDVLTASLFIFGISLFSLMPTVVRLFHLWIPEPLEERLKRQIRDLGGEA